MLTAVQPYSWWDCRVSGRYCTLLDFRQKREIALFANGLLHHARLSHTRITIRHSVKYFWVPPFANALELSNKQDICALLGTQGVHRYPVFFIAPRRWRMAVPKSPPPVSEEFVAGGDRTMRATSRCARLCATTT